MIVVLRHSLIKTTHLPPPYTRLPLDANEEMKVPLSTGQAIISELVRRFHRCIELPPLVLLVGAIAQGVVAEISRRFDSFRVEMWAWWLRVAKQ